MDRSHDGRANVYSYPDRLSTFNIFYPGSKFHSLYEYRLARLSQSHDGQLFFGRVGLLMRYVLR